MFSTGMVARGTGALRLPAVLPRRGPGLIPDKSWLLGWRKFKPVAYIWNGQNWHSISLPANTFMATVLLGPSDAWLVGQATKIGKHVVTPLWRWNGSSRQSYQIPARLASLRSSR